MRAYRVSLLTLLFTVLFAFMAAAEYTLVRAPQPEDALEASIYELDNGLTVYITEYHEEPRFYAEIAVRAGSKQDPAEATGLAHYLEHLLFKGSSRIGTVDYAKEQPLLEYIADLYELHFNEEDPEKRRALYTQINAASRMAAQYAVPNELDRIYQAMGGNDLNAHTWHEETVYKVSLPKNRLEQWAMVEGERFAEPVFRLFQTELETVYEEMNRALDNKHRIIRYAVNARLFKEHPYGQQPTLGLPDHLKNPSLRRIAQYYDTWYVPNNMAIIISGDVDTEETIAIIDEQFSRWKRKDLPEPKEFDEPPLEGREYVERSYEGEEYVLLAYRTAAKTHEDAEALRMLDMILDNATAGLINLNLNQTQKVRSAGSYPAQYNDHGAQYLWGIPKQGQSLEEVESLLLAQLDKVRKGEFDDDILEAILLDFRKNQERMLEKNGSRVALMRDAFIAFEPWDRALDTLDRMAAVTKDDVVRVANTYFSRGYVAGYRIDAPHEVPEVEKPELANIAIDPTSTSAFAREIAAMPVPEIEPVFVTPGKDFQTAEAAPGRTLYHAPNPVNHLFSLTFTIDLGRRQDHALGIAARLLDKAGTEHLSPEELKKAWYRIGADFHVAVDEDETNITLSGLDDHLAEALALMAEALETAAVPDDALAELKNIVLQERADARKQAENLARALTLYHRHGEHSPNLERLSTAEIEALEAAPLLDSVAGLLDYQHAVSYVGSLPMADVQALLAEHLPAAAELPDTPAYAPRPVRNPEATEIYLVDKETAAAHVRIEFPDGSFSEELSVPMQLFNEYFSGGMAGVVFQELREARALAYSAGARYFQGDRPEDPNLMVAAIQTQADKTPEATAAFIGLIDEMPASEDRFARAKNALVNLYRTGRIGFREVLGAVRQWERLGLEPDPRKARFDLIKTSGPETLFGFHTDHVQGRPKLISIVGAKSKMDVETIEQTAPITEITVDQLFRD
ncbi:MAG: M16 family metallopeptidase [Candidatus Hydrogenedentota bacterium]